MTTTTDRERAVFIYGHGHLRERERGELRRRGGGASCCACAHVPKAQKGRVPHGVPVPVHRGQSCTPDAVTSHANEAIDTERVSGSRARDAVPSRETLYDGTLETLSGLTSASLRAARSRRLLCCAWPCGVSTFVSKVCHGLGVCVAAFGCAKPIVFLATRQCMAMGMQLHKAFRSAVTCDLSATASHVL